MRIAYKDPADEFVQLLQSCMNRRDKISAIEVTKAELSVLLKHPNAKQFLGDYISQRTVEEQRIRQRMFKLGQELEHVKTQDDRQRIWDATSECEEQLHTLFNTVPKTIMQSGILIRVTMKG